MGPIPCGGGEGGVAGPGAYMEVSINGGTPNRWFRMEIPLNWMIWGYPYFRKFHIEMYTVYNTGMKLDIR